MGEGLESIEGLLTNLEGFWLTVGLLAMLEENLEGFGMLAEVVGANLEVGFLEQACRNGYAAKWSKYPAIYPNQEVGFGTGVSSRISSKIQQNSQYSQNIQNIRKTIQTWRLDLEQGCQAGCSWSIDCCQGAPGRPNHQLLRILPEKYPVKADQIRFYCLQISYRFVPPPSQKS